MIKNANLDERIWELVLKPWIDTASEEIEALGKKNNKKHHFRNHQKPDDG